MQSFDLQACIVPYSKDLVHICLEPEADGFGMTFNRFYVGSSYPYFISYRGKWVYLFYRGYSCKSFKMVKQIDDQTEAEELVNAIKKKI